MKNTPNDLLEFAESLKARLRAKAADFTEFLPYADGGTEEGYTSELRVISDNLDREIDDFAKTFASRLNDGLCVKGNYENR